MIKLKKKKIINIIFLEPLSLQHHPNPHLAVSHTKSSSPSHKLQV